MLSRSQATVFPPAGGFTLVEVLVAIVVLSIGILGVAALQTRGLVQGQGGLQASQAITLANAYADMMRANPVGAEDGDYQISDPINSPPSTAPTASCTFTATPSPCTAAQIAAWDQYSWFKQVGDTLPGGLAQVQCIDGANCASSSIQTIRVFWDQARTGVQGLGCSADSSVDLACVTISLQP